MNSDARERVGKAIRDKRTMDEYYSGDINMANITDAAIAECNAWLWERADDPEVVEAYTKALTDEIEERHHARWVYDVAAGVVETMLETAIGPRPGGEEAAGITPGDAREGGEGE